MAGSFRPRRLAMTPPAALAPAPVGGFAVQAVCGLKRSMKHPAYRRVAEVLRGRRMRKPTASFRAHVRSFSSPQRNTHRRPPLWGGVVLTPQHRQHRSRLPGCRRMMALPSGRVRTVWGRTPGRKTSCGTGALRRQWTRWSAPSATTAHPRRVHYRRLPALTRGGLLGLGYTRRPRVAPGRGQERRGALHLTVRPGVAHNTTAAARGAAADSAPGVRSENRLSGHIFSRFMYLEEF